MFNHKRITNWNIYLSKVSLPAPNPYLEYFIDPSFQGVNKLFVLLFRNNFFNQPVKNKLRTPNYIRKITIA